MNTDMVNLGPPLKALPDLKVAKNTAPQDPEADKAPGSFEKILSSKTAGKSREATGEPAKTAVTAQKNIKNTNTKESVEGKKSGESEEAESPVVVQTTAPVAAGKPKLSERQKVMQKFMDSMESEFGIPPESILEALDQLSDSELLLSPEKTAPQVIDTLELDPVEAEKAEAMYLAMLTQLSGTLPQVKDPEPIQPGTKALLQNVLSARERREALNASLDRMNSAFFMKPETRLPNEMLMQVSPETKPGLEGLDTQAQLRTQAYGKMAPSLQDVKTVLAESQIDPRTLSPEAQEKLAQIQSQMTPTREANTAELKDALMSLGVTAAALQQALQADPQNAQALKLEQQQGILPENGKATAAMGATALALNQVAADSKGQGKSDADQGSSRDKDSALFESALSTPTKAAVTRPDFVMPEISPPSLARTEAPALAAAGLATGAATARVMDAESNVEGNLQALMKQAQYVIKKGGGEATVKMNPEGMGQVHLKVMLSEGKVNLEMKTETNEAKKLIESSLPDLKTSLGIHKLAVDHVKVDVNSQLGSQNDQQRSSEQQNMRHDQQREQARQFFNQFHEGNQSRREGYYETSGVKAYSRGRNTAQPLRSGEENGSARTRRYQGAGKGSGLDLVA